MATQVQRVRVPLAGLDEDNSPDYVSERHAPEIVNLLVGGGRLTMRGPFDLAGAFVTGTAGKNYYVEGLMTFGSEMIVSRDHGFANEQEHRNLGSGAATALGATPTIQSRRHCRVGDYVYGPGTKTPGNGIQLNRWPGGAVLPTALGTTVAPVGACDVAAHLERVWTLGASLNGAGGASSLMWSKPGGTSAAPVAADWQDSVSGLYNQIVVGAVDDDAVVGLGKAGRSLVIFKRGSIYVLNGQTTSSFSLQRYSDQLGCIDRNSILSYNDGTYFLSDRGLMYFDGADVAEVSAPLRKTFREAARFHVRADAGVFGSAIRPYSTVEDLGGGYLFVALGHYQTPALSSGENIVTPRCQYIYDTMRQVWSRVVISGSELGTAAFKPTAVFTANDRAVASDGNSFGYADTLVAPTTTLGIDEQSGSKISVVSSWHSRVINLGYPSRKAVVERIMLDYRFLKVATPSTVKGWTVSLYDGTGTLLYSKDLSGDDVAPDANLYRQKIVLDCFVEANDVQLRVTRPSESPAQAIEAAEIFDAVIEYSVAQQR